MSNRQEQGGRRLDDAARAGWLYYVAGNNQEEIAKKLNVSRQTAQRLVSLSVSEGLIKVRLDHPIGRCMELAEKLRQRFALDLVEVVPSDPESHSTVVGVAQAAAAEIERRLRAPTPIIMAIGTGRTLKAAIEQLSPMEAPQHKIVSLTGNIAPDGSASYYNVIFNMADAVKARMFPMPLPVIASSPEEREMLLRQPMVKETLALDRQGRHHLHRHRRSGARRAALPRRLHHRDGAQGAAEGRRRRRDRRLGLRCAGQDDRRAHQRPSRERADALARDLNGCGTCHGR